MKYRTRTLYNQKHAERFWHSTSQTCPLCPILNSALDILPGCQHTQIRTMITERHNLACSMIFKAISKTGSLGSCFVCMDIGSSERLAMQNLQISNTVETRIIPTWLISPHFSDIIRFTVRMLYWLVPSPQKQKSNRLAMKGGGFLGVAGGN